MDFCTYVRSLLFFLEDVVAARAAGGRISVQRERDLAGRSSRTNALLRMSAPPAGALEEFAQGRLDSYASGTGTG